MRGKPKLPVVPADTVGIIPAHAGQTGQHFLIALYAPDHPRACGANVAGRSEVVLVIGSSPRMRGKRLGIAVEQFVFRIIPAHAGQTGDHGDGTAG